MEQYLIITAFVTVFAVVTVTAIICGQPINEIKYNEHAGK
jgi:hypothetical protein